MHNSQVPDADERAPSFNIKSQIDFLDDISKKNDVNLASSVRKDTSARQ